MVTCLTFPGSVAGRLRTIAVAAAFLAMPAMAAAALAQDTALLPQWEARADAVLSPGAGALAGLGINVRAGWYARLGLAGYAGAVRRAAAWEAQQRVEATARFVFDPFAERRRGFYAGAGIGVRAARADGQGTTVADAFLLGVIGVEGAATGQVVPALEFTLGGGARLGVVLRARRRQGR